MSILFAAATMASTGRSTVNQYEKKQDLCNSKSKSDLIEGQVLANSHRPVDERTLSYANWRWSSSAVGNLG